MKANSQGFEQFAGIRTIACHSCRSDQRKRKATANETGRRSEASETGEGREERNRGLH